jgi:hypothetical protein
LGHPPKIFPVYNTDHQSVRELVVLFHCYDQKEIVPLPELNEFIQNGFRTAEEIKQEEEKQYLHDEIADRKK